MKNITLKDVAQAAGVSYTTVSRALSGSTQISGKTRDRILQICDEMGYTTDYIARSMVIKKTDLIGLVVPSVNNQFMLELALHAEMCARKHGYNLMLCNSGPDLKQEKTVVKLLLGRKVDGILIVPQSSKSYENIKSFTERVPMVFLSENLREQPQSYVSVDNSLGTYMGTKYLYELGHRNIIYLGRRNTTTHHLRADGYKKACYELGLQSTIIDSPHSCSTPAYGYEMAVKLFRERSDFTAIMASTDSIALGVIRAADELQIKIPQQLSLIGFDNIASTELPRIDLTTIGQPKQEMAVQAMNVLLQKIEQGTQGYTHQILIPTLEKRGTCAPVCPES